MQSPKHPRQDEIPRLHQRRRDELQRGGSEEDQSEGDPGRVLTVWDGEPALEVRGVGGEELGVGWFGAEGLDAGPGAEEVEG